MDPARAFSSAFGLLPHSITDDDISRLLDNPTLAQFAASIPLDCLGSGFAEPPTSTLSDVHVPGGLTSAYLDLLPVQPVNSSSATPSTAWPAASAIFPSFIPNTNGIHSQVMQPAVAYNTLPPAGPSVNLGSAHSTLDSAEAFAAAEVAMLEQPEPSPSGRMTETKKSTSVQEKNRRAQKRFRERQKAKMSSLEVEVDELRHEVSSMSLEGERLRNRNNVLEKVLKLRDEQISLLQEKVKIFDGAEDGKPGMAPVQPVADPGEGDPVSKFPAEALSRMSGDDVIRLWKEYLKELSVWMVLAECPTPDPAVVDKVEAIITEAGTLSYRVAVLNPMGIKRLVSCNLEDGEEGSATLDHWRTVVPVLNLTDEQKQEALRARSVFLARLEDIAKEREQINQKLQTSIPVVGSGANQTTAASLQTHAAFDKLKVNLRKEHNIHWELCGSVLGRVLTKLQLAKAAVHSFPYYPDPLGICNVLAEEAEGTDRAHTTNAVNGV